MTATQVDASRPPVALVSGWGIPVSLLESLGHAIAGAQHETIALPGHDGCSLAGAFDPDPVVDSLLERLPAAGVWIGWSLGGQLLLEAAVRQPPRALVLIAATPRFTAGPDWPYGVDPAALEALRQACEASPEAARRRFLGLLATSGAGAREASRQIRDAQRRAPEVVPAALAGGLTVLGALDQREMLERVCCPTLWVMGGSDPLMDAAGADWAASRMPDAIAISVKEAGHAPFLSHADACRAAISAFLMQRLGAGAAYHDVT